MVHACFAIPDFWLIVRVPALAYFTCVNPIVSCPPVLAPRASTVRALDCSGVESRQWRGRTRRGQVHRLVRVEDREDGHN
eukprot:5722700-Alexandrium_andersonii.AAC.1